MCDVWKEIRQESLEEGAEKERVKIALTLLRKKADLELIRESCDIGVSQLRALARKNNIDYAF